MKTYEEVLLHCKNELVEITSLSPEFHIMYINCSMIVQYTVYIALVSSTMCGQEIVYRGYQGIFEVKDDATVVLLLLFLTNRASWMGIHYC